MKSLVKKYDKKIVSKLGNTEIVQTKDYISFKVKPTKRRKATA